MKSKKKPAYKLSKWELAEMIYDRLAEIGVSKHCRAEIGTQLIVTEAPLLRQRKPGSKNTYRSVFLDPEEGWTLDSVRRMLEKPW